MKNKIHLFIFGIFILFSCKNENEVVILTTAEDVISFSAIDASSILSITSNSDWHITCDENWCHFSDSVGNGNVSLVLLCDNNLTITERETVLRIKAGDQSKSVVVKQKGGIVIFDENFVDNTNNWMLKSTDTLEYRIADDFYVLKNLTQLGAYFVGTKSLIPEYYGSYQISLRYVYISGYNPFGFTFANKNSENLYRFLATPTGSYSFTKREENVNTNFISSNSSAIGSDNTLRLIKIGTHCEMFVNDTLINTFELSTAFGSYVGFYLCAQTEVKVDFLNIIKF